MKNITVSVDEATHRLARVRAAELDTSVSALVRGYLRGFVRGQAPAFAPEPGAEAAHERRGRLLREVVAGFDSRGVGLRISDNLPREALYDRRTARAEAQADRDRGGRGSS